MSIVFNGSRFTNLEGLINKVESAIGKDAAYDRFIKAEALRVKNHFWDSIDEYLAVIELDENNLDAYKGLGLSYKQVGFINSAIEAFNNAKRLNPFDKSLYFEAGCCYCMDKNFKPAIKEFKRALKLSPEFAEARYNLALAYEMSAHNTQAIEEYRKLIEQNPEFIQSYNSLGSLYMKLDNYAEAAGVFKNSLKVNPEFTRAYLGIAISCDKTGNRTGAMRYYKKYLKQKPNSDNIPFIMDRIFELKKQARLSTKKSHLMLVS